MKKSFLVLVVLVLASSTSYTNGFDSNANAAFARERIVVQTSHGDLTFALYAAVAPATAAHVLRAFDLGLYVTNHFFRIDRGFVAQVADCANGRRATMNAEQRAHALVKIKGEFSDVKHRRGTLSMARFDDVDSATTSFSVLLGEARHLDGKYAAFGEMTDGEETLKALERVETRREGIFVKPVERIEILATYVVREVGGGSGDASMASIASGGRRGEASGEACATALETCRARADSLAKELHGIRSARLPGN